MNKNSKFNLSLFLAITLAFFAGFFVQPKLVSHATAPTKAYEYIVSNAQPNSNELLVFGKYQNNEAEPYLLGNSILTLNDAMNLIELDLDLGGKSLSTQAVSINFDLLVLNDNSPLNISAGTLVFSGNITNFASTLFDISALENVNLTLKNLTISSASQKIININKSQNDCNLTLENSAFASTAATSYAIFSAETNVNLTLSNANTHSTSFLINYQPNLSISFNNFSHADLTSPLKIAVSSNVNNQVVLTNFNSSHTEAVKFLPLNDAYFLDKSIDWHNKVYSVTAKFNLATNTNGGEYQTDYQNQTAFEYGEILRLVLDLQNRDFRFGGWFGSVELDSQTYYFDASLLALAAQNNFDTQFIKNNFAASLGQTENNLSFVKFFDNLDQNNLALTQNFTELFETFNQPAKLIAKWEYKLTLVLGESQTSEAFVSTDAPASLDNPVKNGHVFDGWFLDETFENACDFSQISDATTLYAKWHIGSFVLKIFENATAPEPISVQNLNYGEKISFPAVSNVGHEISGWKTLLGEDFLSLTMPGSNTSIYPIWQKKTYITYFESESGYINPVWSKYQEEIAKPQDPTREGYTFAGWVNKSTGQPFDFSSTPDIQSQTAVAKWTANSYLATFIFDENTTSSIRFGETIFFVPVRSGYKFLGWFDENKQKHETMPAKNITLYPKWQAKFVLTPALDRQTQTIGSATLKYKVSSDVSGFVVEYFVNDSWQTAPPTAAGVYDVRVSRMEDDNYVAFSEVLPNGFKLLPKQVSLALWIAILTVMFFIEIALIVFIRVTIRHKKTSPSTFAIIFPFAMFNTGEFVALIILACLVLAGFVWLIRDLAVLSNTTPEASPENKYDNRLTISKLEDTSNDIEIEQKVDDLLVRNDLAEPEFRKKHKQKTEDYLRDFDDNN